MVRTMTQFHILVMWMLFWLSLAFDESWSAGQQVNTPKSPTTARVLFLHHSTGECIWNGGVQQWMDAYARDHQVKYSIIEQAFPKESPYGWENFPYDYWNIWVKHAGSKKFKEEPTLEILSKEYDVIILKHCFPVSLIEEDTGRGHIDSSDKRAESYKLQYAALRKKMREFPKVKFIVWTGAALRESETNEASARRAKDFFAWVRKEWDQPRDNIYLWDFWMLETEGGLYLKPDFAMGDSHPNETFSKQVAPLLGQRIVDVIEGRGDTGSLTGGSLHRTVVAATKSEPFSQGKPTQPGAKIIEDAETPAQQKELWGEQVKYVNAEKGHAAELLFSVADEEDWGEYGKQRVIRTKPQPKSLDIRGYRYLSLRVKSDRNAEIVLSLVTLPEPTGGRDQPHVKFSSYLKPEKGAWKTLTVDLAHLEIAVEGDKALEKTGNPQRPNDLTFLQFSLSSKHSDGAVLVDDLMLIESLSEELKDTLVEP